MRADSLSVQLPSRHRCEGNALRTMKTILIHVSGHDQPGITAKLTEILAAHDVNVLDIGQAVVHETLVLGLLIELPSGESLSTLSRKLESTSAALGLQTRLTPI